jgi:hypothetical protein
MKEVVGVCRKLHKKELHNLYYCLPDMIRVIKSMRMRWALHVVCVRTVDILVGKSERNKPFG